MIPWLVRMFAPDTEPRTIASCPNPICGWQDPIIVSVLARTTYNAGGVASDPSGKLCRCPMCRWMFVVTARGVRRCQFDADVETQQQQRQQNGPRDVRPEDKPRGYPNVPADMQAFFSREPGT